MFIIANDSGIYKRTHMDSEIGFIRRNPPPRSIWLGIYVHGELRPPLPGRPWND